MEGQAWGSGGAGVGTGMENALPWTPGGVTAGPDEGGAQALGQPSEGP